MKYSYQLTNVNSMEKAIKTHTRIVINGPMKRLAGT